MRATTMTTLLAFLTGYAGCVAQPAMPGGGSEAEAPKATVIDPSVPFPTSEHPAAVALREAIADARGRVSEIMEVTDDPVANALGDIDVVVLSPAAFADRMTAEIIAQSPSMAGADGRTTVLNLASARAADEAAQLVAVFSLTTRRALINEANWRRFEAMARDRGVDFDDAVASLGAGVFGDAIQKVLVEPVGIRRRYLMDDARFDIIRGLGEGIAERMARLHAREAGNEPVAALLDAWLEANATTLSGDRRRKGLTYVEALVAKADIGTEMKTIWDGFFNPPAKLDPASAPGSGASRFKRPMSALVEALPAGEWVWREAREPLDSPRLLRVALSRPIRFVTPDQQEALRVGLTNAELFGWLDTATSPQRILTVSVLEYEDEAAARTARSHIGGAFEAAFARLDQEVPQEDREIPVLFGDYATVVYRGNDHGNRGKAASSAVAAGRIRNALFYVSFMGEAGDHADMPPVFEAIIEVLDAEIARADDRDDAAGG